MRILITGGFGYVGGRLAVHLAQEGHQIVLGSRHLSAAPEWLPQAEVAKIAWNDELALESSCASVDVIIHAAGMNSQDCAADPLAALAFNGLATARLVDSASQAGVKKFIYLSTAHVYANPLVGTITEETCPHNFHPYATSHLAGEQSVLSAHLNGKLQGLVLRLSNAFGSPMHKDTNCWRLLVNDLCKQAIITRQLVLHTSGLQQRDFIGLTEVCRVVERLAICHIEPKQASIFNVGAGTSQSVLAMAQLIQQRCSEVLGFTPKLEHKESDHDEQHLPLVYSSVNLKNQCANRINQTMQLEIDRILKFCSISFNQKKLKIHE